MKRILLIALFLLAGSSGWAGSLTCGVCSRSISGSYIEVDGAPFHEACYTRHQAPRCALCNDPITGQYTVYDDKNYHTRCYRGEVAHRCGVCGSTVEGYHLIDFWGNHYHERHGNELPSCDFCGRLISERSTGGGVTVDNIRTACNLCRNNGIKDFSEAKRLLAEVRDSMMTIGVDINFEDIDLSLVSPRQLIALSGTASADLFGCARYEYKTIFGIAINQRFDLYLLEGLPRMQFVATAAHELMHTWFYRNGPKEVDPSMLEGSCSFAAYRVLQLYDNQASAYVRETMEQSNDPIYGHGWRRVATFVTDRGLAGWLSYSEEHRYLPVGF